MKKLKRLHWFCYLTKRNNLKEVMKENKFYGRRINLLGRLSKNALPFLTDTKMNNKRGVYRTPPKRLNESKTPSDKYHLSKFICPINYFISYFYFLHKFKEFKFIRLKFNTELFKSLNRKTALIAEEHRFSGDSTSGLEFDTHFNWQRPTLPLLRSTIGVTGFNFSVRNGKRWIPRCYSYLDHLITYLRNLIFISP